MTYEWTAEQIASLVPGCTVVYDGELRGVDYVDVERTDEGPGNAATCSVAYFTRSAAQMVHPLVEFDLQHSSFLHDLDPSTIKPPTVGALTRLAVEAFGEGATVRLTEARETPGIGRMPARAVVRCRGIKQAQFFADTDEEAARDCARYLAGRRK